MATRAEQIEKAARELDAELTLLFEAPTENERGWAAIRAALALPPDPAPGMLEIEDLLREYRSALVGACHDMAGDSEWRTVDEAEAALNAAIRRALAAPEPDRYAEGLEAAASWLRENANERYDQGSGWKIAEEMLRALPVPEPAPLCNCGDPPLPHPKTHCTARLTAEIAVPKETAATGETRGKACPVCGRDMAGVSDASTDGRVRAWYCWWCQTQTVSP